nr:dihydrodipicolinate synthase family protein [Nannocystis pusilla]
MVAQLGELIEGLHARTAELHVEIATPGSTSTTNALPFLRASGASATVTSAASSANTTGSSAWVNGSNSAPSHVIPRLNLELYEAVIRGDLDGARRSFYRQLPFLQFIVAHGLPRALAAALELCGTRVGPLRAPLRPLEPPRVAELRQILVDLEVLPASPRSAVD